MSRKIKWHKIDPGFLIEDTGSTDGLLIRDPGSVIHDLHIAGKDICMVRQGEQWHAFAAKCPHASGRFVDGWCDPLGNVVCPLHRYKFNMTNGRNTSGEGYHLKTYPVEQRPDGLYVGMEEGGLGFGLFR
jgi:3-phenylpropionate/trans-cinnamate dioxygenase ferredoxin subunit